MPASDGAQSGVSLRQTVFYTLESKLYSRPENDLRVCCAMPGAVIAGTSGGTLHRWFIPEKPTELTVRPSWTIQGHQGAITALHFSEGRNMLFSGSADRCVHGWSFTARAHPTTPAAQITGLDGSPLGIDSYSGWLFVCVTGGVLVYKIAQKVKEGEAVLCTRADVIAHPHAAFTCLCWAPNRTVEGSGHVYVGLDTGAILQYDAELGANSHFTLTGPAKRISENAVFSLAYSRSEGLVVICAYDQSLRIFNPRNGRVSHTLRNSHNCNFVTAEFDEGTREFVVADRNGHVYVWEAAEVLRNLVDMDVEGPCRHFAAAGPCYFLYLRREGLVQFNVTRGIVMRSFPVHRGLCLRCEEVLWDAGQPRLVTVGTDLLIRLWDPQDMSLREEHTIATRAAILSVVVGQRARPDGIVIWAVSGHDEGRVVFSNVCERKSIELASPHRNSVPACAVVEFDRRVVVLTADYLGFCATWAIDAVLDNVTCAPAALLKTWQGSEQEILTAAGAWLGEIVFATGGNDRTIRVWREVDQQWEAQPLLGHTDSVTTLAFDGFFLFSGAEDCSVRIWDVASMVQLRVFSAALGIPSLAAPVHNAALRAVEPVRGVTEFASCDASGLLAIVDYVTGDIVYQVRHPADCRTVFIERAKGKITACVRGELIPHLIQPDEQTLPKLQRVGSRASQTLTGRAGRHSSARR